MLDKQICQNQRKNQIGRENQPLFTALSALIFATKFFASLILTLITCNGCQKSATAPLREKLHTVTLVDGVSKPRALLICECYFAKEVGCGAFGGIHDGGDRWIVDAKFGVGGDPVKGFNFDKKSGKVVSPIGPSYDNPLEIFP